MSKPRYNAGHRFEMQVAESFGVTSPLSGHGSDLELEDCSVEIKKSLSVDFGQGCFTDPNDRINPTNRWRATSRSAVMNSLFIESGLDIALASEWTDDSRPDVKVDIASDSAARYYREKGDSYIYIGTHGLYRVGAADPRKTGAPILSGISILRARMKCHSKSRGDYRPNFAVKIISLEKSPVSLDILR
jgi:hypothetical protein